MPNIDSPSSNPTPIFANHAAALRRLGLCPIPCGGDDGKKPLVETANWRHRPGPKAVMQLAGRPEYAAANVGILTGLSNITIVDSDDADLLPLLEKTFGWTPLLTRTPSGGFHLWYRSSGERSANLRTRGLAVDIKGHGGFVVVPPSRRWSGPYVGVEYVFERGSWDDLRHLPTMPNGALKRLIRYEADAAGNAIVDGVRNKTLFHQALRLAPLAADAAELAAMVDDMNASRCEPPVERAEAMKAASSAWRYQEEGRNWVVVGAFQVSHDHLKQMPGPKAFWLLAFLWRAHAASNRTFKICARAMAMAGTVPEMGERAIIEATQRLVEAGYLTRIYQGGKRPGDASEYRLGHDLRRLVTE